MSVLPDVRIDRLPNVGAPKHVASWMGIAATGSKALVAYEARAQS